MRKKIKLGLEGALIIILITASSILYGQTDKSIIEKYFVGLPDVPVSTMTQKYRMTAVYTNRDLYGVFMNKTKISGEYTRGLENGFVEWNNILLSGSNSFIEPFPQGTLQEYMENFKYIPSSKMLEPQAFKDFPSTPDAVYAKNLAWDMMAIEGFAWDYNDSLKLNRIYFVPEIKEEFAMADIGTYFHNQIQVCWTGISEMNGELCAVIEYRAIDNNIALSMDGIKSKGTEQYWGTTWISLNNRMIESAVMYSGSMQEIEIKGFDNKFLIKTIRELWVDKIN